MSNIIVKSTYTITAVYNKVVETLYNHKTDSITETQKF